MNRLVQIDDLKTNYWHKISKQKEVKPIFNYDATLDTLFVYFSPEETGRTITHFVDDNVAFLYRYADKEIIGMRIEEFDSEFLPSPPNTKVWKLSDLGIKLNGICDFIFAVEKVDILSFPTRPVEREIKVLEPVFA